MNILTASQRISIAEKIQRRIVTLTNSIRSIDRVDLVTLMTALVVLQHSPGVTPRVMTTLVFAAVVIPPIRRSGWFWLAVAGLRFVNQMPELWSIIDNHQYLITWWCLGLGLTMFASNVERAMRITSRMLIGFCFLFATAWKIRSPDFLNGNFFSWTFVTDDRLRAFAQSFLGFPSDGHQENVQARALLKLGGIGTSEVLSIGPGVRPMAIAAAWYTVLIEGTVAALYLLPMKYAVTRYAPWALLVFIVTVYPIAPVVGFALTLIALSLAATASFRRWPIVAAALFALIPLIEYAETAFELVG